LIAYHVRIPLRKTIRHASHTRSANDTLIVHCVLNNGIEGWGEGLPRPYVTGETIDSAFEQLQASDLKRGLGEPFENLRTTVAIAEAFRLDPLGTGRRDCFGNAARCAVELSLLDAAAQAEGVPLSEATRMVPETVAIRQRSERVGYSGVLPAMSAWKERLRALQLRCFGFRHVKVKVGMADGDDAASVQRIRRWLGQKIDLRIDANEAWTCETLEARLAPLLPFRISSVEQPVPHDQADGLAAVRPNLATPIMLDESLCSLGDARRAIERGTCDLFNIRLSKCGGFLNSLKLAAMAHQAGLGYQLGCQVGETGILSAAGRHFAASVAGIRYVEGSFDRFLVKERLTVEDLTFGFGGQAPALTKPGLGVNLDRPALQRVCVKEEHWRF
jgi:L-Ala-D/L-Glu epimerase